jgi:hypothetical protein
MERSRLARSFARYHTDDVLVDVHGQASTHGIEDHIDAMKVMVQATGGTPARIRSHPINSDPVTGHAWSENSRTAPEW